MRFLTWRAKTAEERERAERIFTEVALPRLERVAEEDALIAAAQVDLVHARSNEFLFEPDMDIVRIRRRLKEAFLKQLEGERVPVADGAMAFPVPEPAGAASVPTRD